MGNGIKDLSNAIRFLSIDAVQKANSGHPGMPMGMADVVTILFKHYLRFNPKNPSWLNRDRFVLSAGHGSMLLYSLLHLTGYKSISLKDIKNFRQLNSICAGHPEYHPGTGIETTTGPLGQGIANSVGFAIAEEILKKKFGKKIFNHKTYVLAGDGCLMEGISHESMSLAGHLKLKNLVMLFDNNSISIDGPTNLAVSDNYKKRFESYGWDYILIDGHNEKEIFKSLKKVQNAKKPTVISCKTTIGYGSPNKSGKASSHGSPLGLDEIKLVRNKLKWKHKPFQIPTEILSKWKKIGNKGEKLEKNWNKFYKIEKKYINKLLKNNFSKILKNEKQNAIKETKSLATRKSSELVLTALTKNNNNLIGGSADLAGSNNTKTKYQKIIKPGNFNGDYIHYGVREHAMCGIMNGIALHSQFIPYGGTFLIFTDYCKPSIRLSALMQQKVIYVMTHDSIGLGEDGPTHQPIEQLSGLRSIPNLNVFRPADRMETIECWELALKSLKTPSVLSLTRQNLQPIRKKYSDYNKCAFGAYEVLRTNNKIKLTILASGSEVNLAIETSHKLAKNNIYSKVISVPCQDIFDVQSKAYKKKILEETKFKISIEAGSTDCWKKYIGEHGLTFGINEFGKSAPYKEIYKHFGLISEKISKKTKNLIKN
ncbi:MAG: transketolase [Pelagibacteraceae bacterium TMED233]|nr:MAG: transketolase [Pelagibacteraceae bacterium TMED233]